MFIRAFYTESQEKGRMVKELRKSVHKQRKELKKKDEAIASLKAQLAHCSNEESSSSVNQAISDGIISQQAQQINELQAKLQKYELMILNQLENEVEMEQDQEQSLLSQSEPSADSQSDHDIESDDVHNAESDDIEKVIESCQETMCQILEGIKTPYDEALSAASKLTSD